MSAQSDLGLLLVDVDSQRPMLDELDMGSAAGQQGREPEFPDHLFNLHADPNDLRKQGWTLMLPMGPRGDRLAEWVSELCEHRHNQGGRLEFLRVPPDQNRLAAIDTRREYLARDKALTARYILILGDLNEISLETQQAFSLPPLFTGRLCFPTEEGYRSYAAKVVRAEKQATNRRARALFFSVDDGTAATFQGHEFLMKTGQRTLTKGIDRFTLAVEGDVVELDSLRGEAAATRFLERAADPHPAVMLSLSHGAGSARWSRTDRRRLQGGLSFGDGVHLFGHDLPTGNFLPNGLWMMVACFGLGTPGASAFHPWLSALGNQASQVLQCLPRDGNGFISRLPQQALANPNGPLGVVGHVDMAWTYGFFEQDQGPGGVIRHRKFTDTLEAMLDGTRVGSALNSIHTSLVDLDQALQTPTASTTDRDGDVLLQGSLTADQQAHMWMLREDLAGTILLGDPAAQLPIKAPPRPRAQPVAPPRPAAAPVRLAPARPEPVSADAVADVEEDERLDDLELLIAEGLLHQSDPDPDDLEDMEVDPDRWKLLEAAYRKAGREALGKLL